MTGVLFSTVTALILPGPRSVAAREVRFDTVELKVAGVVSGVMQGDFNGDGRSDLLVLHSTGDYGRVRQQISVFYQWEDGTFSTASDQRLTVDSPGQAVSVEPEGGGRPAAILVAAPDGVYRYSREDGQFESEALPVIRHPTLFVSDEVERLVEVPSLAGLAPDSTQRIFLPTLTGLILYERNTDETYVSVDSIAYHLSGRFLYGWDREVDDHTTSVRQVVETPRISWGDLGITGESAGGDDVILLYEGKMEGYTASDSGGYASGPDIRFDYDLAASTPLEEGGFGLQSALYDLNADGFSDIVVTRQEGRGLGGFTSTVDVYFGPLARVSDGRPSQRLVFEDSFSYALDFMDLDGDGRLEMAVPIIKIGVFDIVRMLTSRSLKITVDMYEIGDDGFYEQTPEYVQELKVGLDFSGGTGEVVGETLDANGDRYLDLAISLDPEVISVFLGRGGGGRQFLERDPAIELESLKGVELVSTDLTGNGLDDLIATYGTQPEGVGIVRLYLNRTGQ